MSKLVGSHGVEDGGDGERRLYVCGCVCDGRMAVRERLEASRKIGMDAGKVTEEGQTSSSGRSDRRVSLQRSAPRLVKSTPPDPDGSAQEDGV